jgi:hypothetical protein
MPATTLWITDSEKDSKIMFITQIYDEGGFTLNIYGCNEDFIPQGQPVTKEIIGDEEDYHKKLRKDASDRGHFVAGHSTNPEWNPDFNPSADKGGHYGC